MMTNSLYRTVVLSGGEGYEEYKSSSSSPLNAAVNVGISLSNLVASSSGLPGQVSTTGGLQQPPQQQQQQQQQSAVSGSDASTAAASSSTTGAAAAAATSFNSGTLIMSSSAASSSNLDDGKEDLVNYVLAWEI